MLPAVLAIPLVLAAQDPAPGSHEGHVHDDDFESIVEHYSQPDLLRWIERHPWGIGTEVRRFLFRFDESRDFVDPEEKGLWFQRAAFLAEVLADEALTAWIVGAMYRDDEQRARFHMVRLALEDLAAAIPKDGTATLRAEIDSLRPPTAPAGAWETCAQELTRVAAAARAAGALDEARALAEEVGDFATRARDGEIALWCAAFLGGIASEDGELAAAAARYAEAAGIARALGDEDGSREFLRSAVEAEEVLRLRSRALIPPPRDESSSSPAGAGDPCREAAFAAARAGEPDEAWRYAEILRARHLSGLRGNMDDPGDIEIGRQALANVKRQAPKPDVPLELRQLHRDQEREIETGVDAALAEFERSAPRSAVLSGIRQSAFDAGRVREQLASTRLDAVVEYVLGEQETLGLAMTSKGTSARILPLGSERIEALSRRLLDPIEKASQGEFDVAKLEFDSDAARELHAALIEPFAASLGARIAIVPDGILWSLPFEILVADGGVEPAVPEPRFRAEDRAVVYLPSAALLGSAWTGPGKGTLVIGSTLESDADALRGIEALAPVRLLSGPRSLEDTDAWTSAANLHFAVKCVLDAGAPWDSHLALKAQTGFRDRLSARGIETLSLQARLVVLPACQVQGEGWAGNGLLALTRSFLAAGAGEAIGSLWRPDPDSAELWTKRFYERIARGEAAHEALREVRLELMKSKDRRGFPRRHPYFWAAWVDHRGF